MVDDGRRWSTMVDDDGLQIGFVGDRQMVKDHCPGSAGGPIRAYCPPPGHMTVACPIRQSSENEGSDAERHAWRGGGGRHWAVTPKAVGPLDLLKVVGPIRGLFPRRLVS